MFDFNREQPLSLAAAAALLPGRPHLSTLHRWRLRGVRGVKLETCLIGGKRVTSREALTRFIQRTTAEAEMPVIETHAERSSEHNLDAVDSELAKEGL